jgi:hypothetical protein
MGLVQMDRHRFITNSKSELLSNPNKEIIADAPAWLTIKAPFQALANPSNYLFSEQSVSLGV